MQQEDNKGIIERTDKKRTDSAMEKHEKQSKSQTKVYKAQHRKAEKTILN